MQPNSTAQKAKRKATEVAIAPEIFLLKLGAGLVLVGGGIYITGKVLSAPIKKLQENQAQNNAANDPESPESIAQDIWNFAHTGWGGVFEDEEAIVAVGKRITDYGAVVKAYRKLYDRELDTDLQYWLDAEEYQQFKANVFANIGSEKVDGVPRMQDRYPGIELAVNELAKTLMQNPFIYGIGTTLINGVIPAIFINIDQNIGHNLPKNIPSHFKGFPLYFQFVEQPKSLSYGS